MGEFFDGLDDPDLTCDFPGAWPEMPEIECYRHEGDAQHLENLPWGFHCSRRRRRQRYYNLSKEEFAEFYDTAMHRDIRDEAQAGKLRKVRRNKFFREAGISRIPNPTY